MNGQIHWKYNLQENNQKTPSLLTKNFPAFLCVCLCFILLLLWWLWDDADKEIEVNKYVSHSELSLSTLVEV